MSGGQLFRPEDGTPVGEANGEQEMGLRKLRLGAVAVTAAVGLGIAATSAAAAPLAHGHLIHIVKPGIGVNTNQSNNWFGYNQGLLEQGGTQFHSISGDWTVPTASQHAAGQEASSSDWIGIGGGCIDANCTLTDPTLIQTGTEQDVDSSGKASYSAWWEIVPVPALTINMTVGPGDHIHASIAETVSGADVWKITLQDVTRGETFTTTVPYPSTHATAEWIEETPLVIGTNVGIAALPNLTNTPFDHGTVNGAPVALKQSEQIQLTDSSGHVIGTPSAPDSDLDGFAACAWATSCPVPAS
jgi:Peptidase A4 family